MRRKNYSLKTILKNIGSDEPGWIEIFRQEYADRMYGIAFSVLKDRMCSEEVVQDLILKLGKLDPLKYPTANEESWLYAVVKNYALSVLRKERNLRLIDDIDEVIAEDDIEKMLGMNRYLSIVSRVDKDRQEVLCLRILNDMTFPEISEILGKPLGTIKWLYATAIVSLRTLLMTTSGFVAAFMTLTAWQGGRYVKRLTAHYNSSSGQREPFFFDYNLFIVSVGSALSIAAFVFLCKQFKQMNENKKAEKLLKK